jgi:hypothetical protein
MLNAKTKYELHVLRVGEPPPAFRLIAVEAGGPGTVQHTWNYASFEGLSYNLSRLGVEAGKLMALDIRMKRRDKATIEGTFEGRQLLETLGTEPGG